jgi:hypothetical protein
MTRQDGVHGKTEQRDCFGGAPEGYSTSVRGFAIQSKAGAARQMNRRLRERPPISKAAAKNFASRLFEPPHLGRFDRPPHETSAVIFIAAALITGRAATAFAENCAQAAPT